MKLIYTADELVQRSPDWLLFREGKLGASAVASILGVNKYEKPVTVWKRMTGRLKPKEMNEAMLRGAEMEDEAIVKVMEYVELSGVSNPSVVPYVCIHPKYTDIAVSFDGVDLENRYITEVKCPKFSQNFKSVFSDGIPEHYHPQVQLQLDVANEHWGIKKAYFGSYFPDGAYIPDYIEFKEHLKYLAVIEEELDQSYCNAMHPVIEKFMSNVKLNFWDKEEYEEVLKTFKESI